MGLDFDQRLAHVRALGHAFLQPAVRKSLLEAYGRDTLLLPKDIAVREVEVPARLCSLPVLAARDIRNAQPCGGVAILMPKNSIGFTIAKAVVGAWLTGNRVVVRFPTQLVHSAPVFSELLRTHLPGIEIVSDCSGPQFLSNALRDAGIQAVVIYGDDSWIDAYRPLAESTRTRVLFEGPGNDPLIVGADADIDAAVDAAIRGGLMNGGQSCSAFERFFVHRDVHANFVGRLAARVAGMRIGPPEQATTDIGPIASPTVRQRLSAQVDDALRAGARLVCGGRCVDVGLEGAEAFEPTVLTGCAPQMRIVAEENFGPVFPVIAYSTLDELMPMLDASQHGLNAAAYGTAPASLAAWMQASHRNWYLNSTPADASNLPTRLADGGMRRSAFIWEEDQGRYGSRQGRRLLALELTAQPQQLRTRTEPLLAAAALDYLPEAFS